MKTKYIYFMITNVFQLVCNRKYSSISFLESILGEDFVQVKFHSQFFMSATCFLTSNLELFKIHIHCKNIFFKSIKRLEFRIKI